MEDLAMHRNALVVGLLLLPALSQPQSAIEKLLHSRYAELDSATMKRDVKALEQWVNRYTTSDFTYTSKDKRKYNRKSFLDGLKQQAKLTKKVVEHHQHSGKPAVQGSVATVKVSSKFEGIVLFDKQELRLVDKSETTDRWVLANGAWKLKSIVQTKADTQIYQK